MPTTRFASLRLLGATLAVLALGFGVAACGGGDDGGEEPAPVTATTTEETVALTQEDLISEGDSICDEANAAIAGLETSTLDETSKSDQIYEIYDGVARELGDLGTPSDGEPPTEVIAGFQDLADGSTDTTALQTAATEYGFTECAEAPSAATVPTESGSSSTGTESTETYTPPATESTETYTPPATTPAAPETGGGVAPTPPPDTGGSSGSSGGSSSGGIGPG